MFFLTRRSQDFSRHCALAQYLAQCFRVWAESLPQFLAVLSDTFAWLFPCLGPWRLPGPFLSFIILAEELVVLGFQKVITEWWIHTYLSLLVKLDNDPHIHKLPGLLWSFSGKRVTSLGDHASTSWHITYGMLLPLIKLICSSASRIFCSLRFSVLAKKAPGNVLTWPNGPGFQSYNSRGQISQHYVS